MRARVIIGLFLALVATGLYFVADHYQNVNITKAYYSVLAVLAGYVVIKMVFEGIIAGRIADSKTRYSMRKISSVVFVLAIVAAAVGIWVDNLQALLVSYGILAAGAAVALQDVFKNLAGGIIIFVSGIYRVGDRIEVNGKIGDVIDIGVFYTTLLETNEWVNGDQLTGRLSTVPNSTVLSGVVNNYTKDHPYIWDEISLPVTYDSDWQAALKIIEGVVDVETKEMTEKSDASVSKLADKYYLPKRATGPKVIVTLTSNWINFNIRYITEVRRRRIVRDDIARRLLAELLGAENVRIASESLDISVREFPAQGPGGAASG